MISLFYIHITFKIISVSIHLLELSCHPCWADGTSARVFLLTNIEATLRLAYRKRMPYGKVSYCSQEIWTSVCVEETLTSAASELTAPSLDRAITGVVSRACRISALPIHGSSPHDNEVNTVSPLQHRSGYDTSNTLVTLLYAYCVRGLIECNIKS